MSRPFYSEALATDTLRLVEGAEARGDLLRAAQIAVALSPGNPIDALLSGGAG